VQLPIYLPRMDVKRVVVGRGGGVRERMCMRERERDKGHQPVADMPTNRRGNGEAKGNGVRYMHVFVLVSRQDCRGFV
jgi:hypothetical protein